MTLNIGIAKFVNREYPMFGLWALRRDTLFLPKDISRDEDDPNSEEYYSLTSQVYFLMKRLRQQYSEIMLMDTEDRETFFHMEMEVLNKELAASKNK